MSTAEQVEALTPVPLTDETADPMARMGRTSGPGELGPSRSTRAVSAFVEVIGWARGG